MCVCSWKEFLNNLLKEKSLPASKLEKMEKLYKLSQSHNTEIVFRWVRVGIAARCVLYRYLEQAANCLSCLSLPLFFV